jgi:glycerol-3-phosphate O-acyltransferase
MCTNLATPPTTHAAAAATPAGVGISVGAELDVAAILAGVQEKEAQQAALASAAHSEVTKEYALLEAAILDPAARASTPQYSQPWLAA